MYTLQRFPLTCCHPDSKSVTFHALAPITCANFHRNRFVRFQCYGRYEQTGERTQGRTHGQVGTTREYNAPSATLDLGIAEA